MGLKEFRDSIREEVQGIVASDFKIIIKETDKVPSIDDPDITYPNLVTKELKCKLIETCVLYIDIRKSTDLNLSHRRETMAKLYSSFVRAMARAGSYYGGKVRNIIGDRLMVVFDSENCFTNAVNTAILMNSVSKYILNKEFPHNEVKCGIGIDYGKMLVTKTGIVKQGVENTSNKSLVWLGRPANVASKLTDAANKTITETKTISVPTICEGHEYPHHEYLQWYEFDLDHFLEERVEETFSPVLKHKSDTFRCYFLSSKTETFTTTVSTSPILMTKEVYDGYKKANPNNKTITESWGWKVQKGVSVSGYSGDIYGGDIIWSGFKEEN
ncbi:Adenylate and Guanylate cyclase catalytic domain protein (plasmid) [Parageobacillus caldoxylosilyticus]|uniref:adenylate/guanylate cyclase domain-containing protein n=1 Tax=Saccharococcus caldoxylosilyticus TaxID=81408 RepID=UPI001C4E0628|nr:adenylate/guanylate cyclase domain-containing protein [Parageobacillus caldoxylosilyticus]QXJ40683.1 Adenylate and Guanylate cyclase catalytic domain protein [Parageobacillus caldoxylosilyticus]